MILKPIPAAERPSLLLKIFAADGLKGQRLEWGSGRKWEGNYLANVSRSSFSSQVFLIFNFIEIQHPSEKTEWVICV